ncbi:hypothetical protein JMA_10340 [Jeotgalibacillus malaysiensis]|uniref:Uncharacterized protein n=1 Tax=Jeotgalibacillus malaysiensis TaxID=1508404 RepID=A0A0B5AJ40_9BACL|nr:hypothetical protein JMA_10340 [Jeotgalibacillus malaysiensis]
MDIAILFFFLKTTHVTMMKNTTITAAIVKFIFSDGLSGIPPFYTGNDFIITMFQHGCLKNLFIYVNDYKKLPPSSSH